MGCSGNIISGGYTEIRNKEREEEQNRRLFEKWAKQLGNRSGNDDNPTIKLNKKYKTGFDFTN